MKTVPLQDLVRRPAFVKKLTAEGQSVRITDHGKPLWVVSADQSKAELQLSDEEARQNWMEDYLQELLSEASQKGKSLAQQVIEDRGSY